jgi:hypothetical protein
MQENGSAAESLGPTSEIVCSPAIRFCLRRMSRLLSDLQPVGSIRPTRVIGEGSFAQSLTSIVNGTIAFERCTCPPMECQFEKCSGGFTTSPTLPSAH